MNKHVTSAFHFSTFIRLPVHVLIFTNSSDFMTYTLLENKRNWEKNNVDEERNLLLQVKNIKDQWNVCKKKWKVVFSHKVTFKL